MYEKPPFWVAFSILADGDSVAPIFLAGRGLGAWRSRFPEGNDGRKGKGKNWAGFCGFPPLPQGHPPRLVVWRENSESWVPHRVSDKIVVFSGGQEMRSFFRAPISLIGMMLSFAPSFAIAQLSEIRVQRLPQDANVLDSLDDARAMEPYSANWSPDWRYDISKNEVASHLSRDLAFLRAAQKNRPEDLELTLLTGIVGRNAYNLDLEGSYETAMTAFAHAMVLAPEDIRGRWFHAALVCSTAKPSPGADEFLAMEDNQEARELPAGFWESYMGCLHIVDMPVHVLRAAKHLADMHSPDSKLQEFFIDLEKKRFEPIDKSKVYEDKETWSSRSLESDLVYTNTACGIAFRVHRGWQVGELRLAKGDCKANLDLGPNGEKRDTASVIIFAESQKPNQTIQDFLREYMPKGYDVEEFAVAGCPVRSCISYRVVQTDRSAEKDKNQNYLVLFERDEPEFPGLALEWPNPPGTSDKDAGLELFHPSKLVARVPGKVFYELDLSFEPGAEPQAPTEFAFLLQNIKVD